MGRRVVAAMSGGVDSSVAAALLVARGYSVIGVTLRLQPCDDEGRPLGSACCGGDGPAQAREVARRLGIPHYLLDAHEEFERLVLRPAWDEYAVGRTPDPCIECNRGIKFGWLREQARAVGADLVATGHYARLEPDSAGRPALLRGADRAKDQSYFLFSLDAAQLDACRFPLGDLSKPEVREQARALGLPNAERPDSQNACLGGPGEPFPEALRRRFDGAARPGDVVDPTGKVVAHHDGIHLFTRGQRRGLGPHFGRRTWVCAVDPEHDRVVVTWEPGDLLADAVSACRTVWHVPVAPGDRLRCTAQVRYRLAPLPAEVTIGAGGTAEVRFLEPVRAATPGQAVVCYEGDRVLGGGWIERAWKDVP